MLRAAVLVCAVILTPAMTARTLLGRSVPGSAFPGDPSDGGCSPTDAASICCDDEALPHRRVAIAQPPLPRLHRWLGFERAIAPSPAPDEILHVPKRRLA